MIYHTPLCYAAIRIGLLAILYGAAAPSSSAQHFESIPFTDSRWMISGEGSGVETYRGQVGIKLGNENGYAQLHDVPFSNGIIEFDVALSAAAGFPGIQFRKQDDLNFEDVYFRAHMNAKDDALAYAPTYGGNSTYQLFHGPGFWGHFEFPFGAWIHARLVISGDQGELYLGDMDVPVMFMHDLKRDEQTGSIGFRGGSDVHFANFKLAHIDDYPLKGHPPEKQPDPPGILNLLQWHISHTFSENLLQDATKLDRRHDEIGGWETLHADDAHIINMMRIRELTQSGNTVFARVTITSDAAIDKILEIGYSDRARVFLNGQMLYAGNTGFRTRDYRYLGSIGFFEQVVLRLQKGDNALWIAVSESFGGWGLKARIPDASSIHIK